MYIILNTHIYAYHINVYIYVIYIIYVYILNLIYTYSKFVDVHYI